MIEMKLPGEIFFKHAKVLISDPHLGLGDEADKSDAPALRDFIERARYKARIILDGDVVEGVEQCACEVMQYRDWLWDMLLCVTYIVGNHDTAMGGPGIPLQGMSAYTYGKLYVEHGERADPWYQQPRWYIAPAARLNRTLHNLLGTDPQSYWGKVASPSDTTYRQYAKELHATRPDHPMIVCLGHSHRPEMLRLYVEQTGKTILYVNLGCFTREQKTVTLFKDRMAHQGSPDEILGVLQDA